MIQALAESVSEESQNDPQDTDVSCMYLYKGQAYNNEEIKPIKVLFQQQKGKASALKHSQLPHKHVMEDDEDGVEEISHSPIGKKQSVVKKSISKEKTQDPKKTIRRDRNERAIVSEESSEPKKVHHILNPSEPVKRQEN